MYEIMGIIAAILTTVSFVPQAYKTVKTKDTSGISFVMYLMFTVGVLLWFIYGLHIENVSLTAANLVTFIFAAVILFYKIGNMKAMKDK